MCQNMCIAEFEIMLQILNSLSSFAILYSVIYAKNTYCHEKIKNSTYSAYTHLNFIHYKIIILSILLFVLHSISYSSLILVTHILSVYILNDYTKLLLQFDTFMINANYKLLQQINKFININHFLLLLFPITYYSSRIIYKTIYYTTLYIYYGMISYILYFTWCHLNKTVYTKLYEKYDEVFGIHQSQSVILSCEIRKNERLKCVQRDIKSYLDIRKKIYNNFIYGFHLCILLHYFYLVDLLYYEFYLYFQSIYYILCSAILYYYNLNMLYFINIENIIRPVYKPSNIKTE